MGLLFHRSCCGVNTTHNPVASPIPEAPRTEEKPQHLDLLPEKTVGKPKAGRLHLKVWEAGMEAGKAQWPTSLSFLLTGPRGHESAPAPCKAKTGWAGYIFHKATAPVVASGRARERL